MRSAVYVSCHVHGISSSSLFCFKNTSFYLPEPKPNLCYPAIPRALVPSASSSTTDPSPEPAGAAQGLEVRMLHKLPRVRSCLLHGYSSAQQTPCDYAARLRMDFTVKKYILPRTKYYAVTYIHITLFSSVQSLSCVCLCGPMDCSTPGFSVHQHLLELAQTHVHRVSDVIQPSHPLSSPSPPAFSLSQHQGLFQ